MASLPQAAIDHGASSPVAFNAPVQKVGASGNIYADIEAWNRETEQVIKSFGGKLSAQDISDLGHAFNQGQVYATTPSAWVTVDNIFGVVRMVGKRALGRELKPAEYNRLNDIMVRMSRAMPGKASPLGVLASSLGGAWKGLADGVSVAAKWTGHAFTDVTSSPLWKIAAGAAFFVPGIGPAISAGMMVASVIGKAASVKDAIIGTAREALPGGEAAQAGFDIGVGVAVHGEGMDEAALNAVRNQIPDGAAKAAFDTALSLKAGVESSKASPPPAHLTTHGKAAYYTTKGLLKAKAPPAMKKAVTQMVVTNTAAHAGLQAAIADELKSEDITWLHWFWKEVKYGAYKVSDSIFKSSKNEPKTVITVHGESVK